MDIRIIKVEALCIGELIDSREAEILKIDGNVLTFKCPDCGQVHASSYYEA